MNIQILWLLVNGKLGSLSQGWIKTQRINPLWDFLRYALLLPLFTLITFIVALCAAFGWGYLARLLLSPCVPPEDPMAGSPLPAVCGTIMMLGAMSVFCVVVMFAYHYQQTVYSQWYKTAQFPKDIKELDCIMTRNGCVLLDAPSDNPTSTYDMQDCLKDEMVRKAVRIMESEQKRSKEYCDDLKNSLKGCFALGKRLDLVSEQTVQPFYAIASRQLESEKKKPAPVQG